MGATEDAAMRRGSRAGGALTVAGRSTYFIPRSFFTAFASTFATGWSLPKSRLRFDDFFVRLWLFIA